MGKFNLDTRLRQALRQVWLRSPMRYAVIKRSRVAPGKNQCESCQTIVPTKEIRVDHIVACGSLKGDVSGFVARLFVEPDGMQALCKPCHDVVTKAQRLAKKSA